MKTNKQVIQKAIESLSHARLGAVENGGRHKKSWEGSLKRKDIIVIENLLRGLSKDKVIEIVD